MSSHNQNQHEISIDSESYVRVIHKTVSIPLENDHNRNFYYINDDDKNLFIEINNWKKSHIDASLAKASSHRNGDAIAKVIYGYHQPDFILKFEEDYSDAKEKREREIKRRGFEQLLMLSGLIVEREFEPQDILLNEGFFSHIIRDFTYEMEGNKVSAFFKKDSPENYIGDNESKDDFILNFWSSARRNLLVHRIIITANQINEKLKNEKMIIERKTCIKSLSINRLLDQKVYNKFYNLHDGSYKEEGPLDKVNLRAKLNQSWAKFSRKKQPLGDIRKYFGEKLALYFTWLGFYTTWLTIPSAGGIIVVVYGLIIFNINGKDSGIYLLWDNALTVPYALLMAIWATCFLETWKRVNTFIKYGWNVMEYEKEELPRPEFEGTVLKRSQITLKKVVRFPFMKKIQKFIISSVIVFVCIGIVIVTIGVLLVFPRSWVSQIGGIWAPVVVALLYKTIAFRLTQFENHRTATQFEDALILKTYLFDFINFYSALFYILILKKQFAKDFLPQNGNYPGCEFQNNCMAELTLQLAIILIGKQTVGHIREVYIPRSTISKNNSKRDMYKNKEVPQWAQDDSLTKPNNVRVEYEEMAFPLAPVPVAFQAQDIGMWEIILTVVSLLAVPTNAVLIAFHSSWLENQFKSYYGDQILVARLVFILIFEHIVFIVKLVFTCLIPDIPKNVKIAIDRENYLARVALDHEPPAIDEYLPKIKDYDDIFTRDGELNIPVGYNIVGSS
ncbi:11329_t:CDS:10 [Entrophospora sp. SA101]|nr:11329_t:CDS:10 [Entrophospora sp. SA101]